MLLLPKAELSHALFCLNLTVWVGIAESLLISRVFASSPVLTKLGDYLLVRAGF